MRVPGHFDTEQRTAATGEAPESTPVPEPTPPPPAPEEEEPEEEEEPDEDEEEEGDEETELSREELYEMAQEMNISGRSKMSRDELEEAVLGD